MTGTEAKELRDTIERLDNDEHNGIHIIGWFPLADELKKAGYRKENIVVEEVLELVRQSIQPSQLTEEFLDRVRDKYFAGSAT